MKITDIEELKKKEEAKKQEEVKIQENVKRVEEVIAPPTRVETQEEILEICFKVRGNREKLKSLVNYLKEGEYEYEQC